MKIVKLASGQILITDDSDVKLGVFNPTDRIFKDQSRDGGLIISTDGNGRDGEGDFHMAQGNVSVPSSTDVDDLFDQLLTTFFTGDGAGAGDASAANQATIIGLMKPSGTAVLTNKASSATDIELAAANTDRKVLHIHNDSTEILYLKYGTGASLTSYTHKVGPDTPVHIDDWNGVVHGIWSAANGNARLTEVDL